MVRTAVLFDQWSNAIQLGLMLAEANAVIAMRVWGIGGLWSVPPSENARMVSEKMQAVTQVATNSTLAAVAGKRPDEVMASAIRPLRQKTRANVKRLAKRGPKKH